MEKTITLTSDELCNIILALTDKINAIEFSARYCKNIPKALKRKEILEELRSKLMNY